MFKFIKEFIKSPKYIGAISPSSKFLASKMVGNIEFERCNCIVEYGAGTGVFTKEVILRKKESTIFLVFEKNKKFADALKNKYALKKNVKIINDGVENIYKYLNEYKITKVNYIISGLPFASLPKTLSDIIIIYKLFEGIYTLLSEKSSNIAIPPNYHFAFNTLLN